MMDKIKVKLYVTKPIYWTYFHVHSVSVKYCEFWNLLHWCQYCAVAYHIFKNNVLYEFYVIFIFKFRDRIFWLPHNMDFRGRVYPCPPHLNHLGSDMARSLLCFAKGKPLGQNGLDWLKVKYVCTVFIKSWKIIILFIIFVFIRSCACKMQIIFIK